MDTPTDIALNKIEAEIKRNRAPFACPLKDFKPVSRELSDYCDGCGHLREDHHEKDE